MVEVKRISDVLEVQSDIFRMDSDELVNKYARDIDGFNKFLTGATEVIDHVSFAWFFREAGNKIGDVLLYGNNHTMNGYAAFEDEFFTSMKKKYNYLINSEEMYHHEKHTYPNYNNKVCDQYYCIQASNIGMSDSKYKDFLVELPVLFEKVMDGRGNRFLDPLYLSTIAYLGLHFPELVLSDDFQVRMGDISRGRIRAESIGSENPELYRKAARCARKIIARKQKEQVKETAKTKMMS